MKKELLLSAALFAAFGVFGQSARLKPHINGIQNVKPLSKLSIDEGVATESKSTGTGAKAEQANTSGAKTSAVNTWTNFSSSSNIYGVLISYCKPLQYNDELGAVSFIHRKPSSYVASPAPAATAANGLMVASISTDWGTSWDSTLIWNNDNNWGRYPGGAIYNPQGNTNLSSAYVVGAGPTTGAAGGWPGNFYASKQLNIFDNVASTVANAQQWKDIASPDPNIGRHDFAAYGFNATDDGKVRVLAGITDDLVGSDSALMLVTGTFNSGVFNYVGTPIYCPVTVASDGSKNLLSRPMMAWNETGTVGYIGVLGQRIGSTLSNGGPQPLVWKTTNSGASWAIIPSIDFNNAAFDEVKRSIASTSNDSTVVAPWFSWLESMDMAVDANNKLHFFSSLYGSASIHPDSIFYLFSFGSEGYRWPHVPGFRPYLYDFMTDGTSGWSYITVDSMSTEGPAGVSTGNGFNYNPWDLNGSDKVRIDARLQMSRTPNGKQIFYSWAESDTNFTSSAVKWNVLPNIKVRAYDVDHDTIFAQEYNVSSPSSGVNPAVASRAMYHFMAPKSSTAAITSGATSTVVTAKLPFTISNSPNFTQLQSNTHWFNAAELSFTLTSGTVTNSINADALTSANSSMLFPNPAAQSTNLGIKLLNQEEVSVEIHNLMGQLVRTYSTEAETGENIISLDLNGLEKGVYLLNVKVGEASSSKKLIIE